jgi:polar amino acid transport system substrate-binding protein
MGLRSKRHCILLAIGLAAAVLGANAADFAEPVHIVTEENPPINFTQNGRVTGFCTEVVEAVLQEIKLTGEIQVLPWARAYETALHSENVLIYSIARTPQREKLFKWVGVIGPSNSFLFSLRGRNLQLDNLEDAKKYRIGTVNEDVREQYLVTKGFVKGANLQPTTKYELGYEKLKRGRIDLWVMDELIAYDLVRRAGDDPKAVLVPSLRLTELARDGSYMAFGSKTDDALVERFRKGLEAIMKNGSYARIKSKWF